MVSSDLISPVGYLRPTAFHVELLKSDAGSMEGGLPPPSPVAGCGLLGLEGAVRDVPADWLPSHRCGGAPH